MPQARRIRRRGSGRMAPGITRYWPIDSMRTPFAFALTGGSRDGVGDSIQTDCSVRKRSF